MSNAILKGNASGTGSVTLESPNTNSDRTISLPDADGTMVYADASGNFLFNSGYGSVATAYGCRAWVNFNGTGTVAIRASGNVSSITDSGTGRYVVNLTNAMPDANYAVAGCAGNTGITSGTYFSSSDGTANTTSAASINTNSATPAAVDRDRIFVAVFR